MPSYEMFLMIRQMPRNELITVMKRAAEGIFERGGFLRKIENLGVKNLPYKVSKNALVHKQGLSFLYHFDIPPRSFEGLIEEYSRDVDIIKKLAVKLDDNENVQKFECTLEEEMKPPAYRKEVIEMLEIAKRRQKEKYPHNTGLSYYPFQK